MEVCVQDRAIRIRSRGPRQTFEIGKRVGQLCRPGDVIGLKGELGSGKTLFAKGIAHGLGVRRGYVVSSPSFTLIHEYPGIIPFYHMDFYRIRGPEEAEGLGLEEYLYGNGVVAIEWPERILSYLLEGYLKCNLQMEGKRTRDITIAPEGKRFKSLFHALCRSFLPQRSQRHPERGGI